MRYLALACDYDGTLTANNRVTSETASVFERHLASGPKLILVMGRQFNDLRSVFSRLDLFKWVVAENGAPLYRPADKPRKGPGRSSPKTPLTFAPKTSSSFCGLRMGSMMRPGCITCIAGTILSGSEK